MEEWEKKLKGHMPDEVWKAFKKQCVEDRIPMDVLLDNPLEFGSVFLTVKTWFHYGWEASQNQIDKE